MPGRLIEFATLCERLAATGSKLEKRAFMAEYLRSLEPGDRATAVLFLAGIPFASADSRQLNVGGALLWRVLAALSEASDEAMHAAYLRHGDLGSAAQDLLPSTFPTSSFSPLALASLGSAFEEIAAAAKPAAKERLLSALLRRANPLEAKYLIKIILGDLRIGVKESLIEEAIAAAYGAAMAQVRRASMLSGSLAEVVALAAERRLNEVRMKLFHPLGFMLASPVATVEEAVERSESSQVQLEDKYDGIRAQIHCGDPAQPRRVALFSRSRGEITVSFPEIAEAFADFPEPVILDGELLAWDPARDPAWGAVSSPAANPAASPGRALPFTALQPRLGRKRVTAAMRGTAPAIFMAFDLLYAAGELLLERPLAERRRALEGLVGRAQRGTTVASEPDTAVSMSGQTMLDFGPPESAGAERGTQPAANDFPRLLLAPATGLGPRLGNGLGNVAQLEQAYVDARARGNEGVMLKSLQSAYQPGRRGMAWLKLKRELATLDVVVTAAEYGHGKRAGTLSDYTFAVWDGGALKNVGKAYSGLTDAEIATLTEFFLEHTVEDFGGMRSVEPLIVLEVAFNNIMRSGRHDGGFALRFPRIVRIRYDKPVSEIDTLERVAGIYESQSLASESSDSG